MRSASASDGRERLLEQDVDAERRDLLDHVGMPRGRGTEDGEIGIASLARIARCRDKHASGGMREIAIASAIRASIGIADPDDLGVGVLGGLAQEVAHVHVLEAQADDPPFRIAPPISLKALCQSVTRF